MEYTSIISPEWIHTIHIVQGPLGTHCILDEHDTHQDIAQDHWLNFGIFHVEYILLPENSIHKVRLDENCSSILNNLGSLNIGNTPLVLGLHLNPHIFGLQSHIFRHTIGKSNQKCKHSNLCQICNFFRQNRGSDWSI